MKQHTLSLLSLYLPVFTSRCSSLLVAAVYMLVYLYNCFYSSLQSALVLDVDLSRLRNLLEMGGLCFGIYLYMYIFLV